jgi:hypothetical protein
LIVANVVPRSEALAMIVSLMLIVAIIASFVLTLQS